MRIEAAAYVLLVAPAIVTGCTAVRPDAEFDAVRQHVAQRTGLQPQWHDLEPEDRQVAERTRALLAADLTMDAAVELALLNNRRLQAAYAELGVSRADLVQAGLLVNPVLSADDTYGVTAAGHGVAIALMQNFMRALQIPLRKRIAEAALEETKLAVASQVIELIVEVKRAYVAVQGGEQLVELDRTVLEATGLSADMAQRQRAAGNVTELDLANEIALFEDARVKLATDEAELLVAREELTALMGLWGPQAAWTIGGRLPDPERDIPAEGLESLAVAQRLDLAAARQATEALHQGLGLTGLYGVMSDAEIGVEGERDIDSGIWSVGPLLSIPIPIFDQGQATRATAMARLRQSEERYAALAIDIRSQVRRARARLSAARALAEHYRRVVLPLRQRITKQAQLQYNAMQIGVFQLLQATQAQVDAGRMYVETVKQYWLAHADLEGAVGGALPGAAPPAMSAVPADPDIAIVEPNRPDGHARAEQGRAQPGAHPVTEGDRQ